MEAKREWFEKDYYAILGVARDASDKDIQRAYRKLARELHPDANPGDAAAEERFKEVAAAYDVVGDPETRKQYDQVRAMGARGMGNPFGGAGGPAGPGGFSFDVRDMGDLGDLFGGLFGGGAGAGPGFSGRPAARRGRDQEAELSLDFDEAVEGVTTSVTVGGGADGGARTLRVRIPAGVADGQRIRLRGKGGPGRNGGLPGDLFVVVRVAGHRLFGRKGDDLTLTLPVTFPEAALGADVEVPTLAGDRVTLRLPPGTQNGRTFRVRGRGIETAKGHGDLLVTVEVAVPAKLNRKQRNALEAFAAASDESPRDHLLEGSA